jgi:hypothetical protein
MPRTLFRAATAIGLAAACLVGVPQLAYATYAACGSQGVTCYAGGGCTQGGTWGSVGYVNGVGYACFFGAVGHPADPGAALWERNPPIRHASSPAEPTLRVSR